MALIAIGLNCILKAGEEPSSTQKLLDQVLRGLRAHKVKTTSVRVANYDIKPGVKTDEGMAMNGRRFEENSSMPTFSYWRRGSHPACRKEFSSGWMHF